MARREHGMMYVNRGPEEDNNIYEAPINANFRPAGPSPPPLPAPRPTVNLAPHGVEKPQEKKTKHSKCLAITFGVTTVLFAGMFAVVFGMFILKDQSTGEYIKVLNASLKENNLKIGKLQTELENKNETFAGNDRKIQELRSTLTAKDKESTKQINTLLARITSLKSNLSTLQTDKSSPQSRIRLYASRIRLSGGPTTYEGRVEIFMFGEWGTVCDDHWGKSQANVVCRQLGKSRVISYDDGERHNDPGPYGAGSGPIWIKQTSCTTGCFFLSSINCIHEEDAWVKCSSD